MPDKSAKIMTDEELTAESERIGSRFRECTNSLEWMWKRILEVETERARRDPMHMLNS